MKTNGMHLIPHKLFTEDIKINSPANDYCNNKKQHFLLETTIIESQKSQPVALFY